MVARSPIVKTSPVRAPPSTRNSARISLRSQGVVDATRGADNLRGGCAPPACASSFLPSRRVGGMIRNGSLTLVAFAAIALASGPARAQDRESRSRLDELERKLDEQRLEIDRLRLE